MRGEPHTPTGSWIFPFATHILNEKRGRAGGRAGVSLGDDGDGESEEVSFSHRKYSFLEPNRKENTPIRLQMRFIYVAFERCCDND